MLNDLEDNNWTQHPEFWFIDGSVILLAHNVVFRVHKTFLARHSAVFRDMFSIPQPSSATDDTGLNISSSSAISKDAASMGGVPVVRIHDSPEDVANLLFALYDGPCVSSSVY